ncbi:MAG: hypothetical protein V4735_02375 [Pseudomonadota bacterium]
MRDRTPRFRGCEGRVPQYNTGHDGEQFYGINRTLIFYVLEWVLTIGGYMQNKGQQTTDVGNAEVTVTRHVNESIVVRVDPQKDTKINGYGQVVPGTDKDDKTLAISHDGTVKSNGRVLNAEALKKAGINVDQVTQLGRTLSEQTKLSPADMKTLGQLAQQASNLADKDPLVVVPNR